jgi:hypothetical protein
LRRTGPRIGPSARRHRRDPVAIQAQAAHPCWGAGPSCRGIAAGAGAKWAGWVRCGELAGVSTTSPEFGRPVDRRWLLGWDLVACGAEVGVLKLLRDS